MSSPYTLELDREGYQPGERATVRVSWKLDEAPRAAALELLYEVRSEHEHETFAVVSVDLSRQPRSSEQRAGLPYRDGPLDRSAPPLAAEDARLVEIDMPRSPNSFEGKLLRLGWTARLRLEPGGEILSVPLSISPVRAPIGLHRPAADG